MLRAEKLKTVSSVKIKEYDSNLKRIMLSSRQKGSILLGIIITMVVMASLGAGMLYLTTTSTFQELFSNNHASAYYAAESGGRYALSVIRDAYATDLTKLNAINANLTFTIANNGGQFQITNFVQNSANPRTVTFASIGTVSSGFLQAKRQINYSIQPANQTAVPGGGGGGEYTEKQINLTHTYDTGTSTVDAAGILKVTGTGVVDRFYATYATTADFYNAYVAQSNMLSYDVQAKVRSTYPDYFAGLGFRISPPGAIDYYFLSAAFAKGDTTANGGETPFSLPDHVNPYIVLWRNAGGADFEMLAYKQLTSADGVITAATTYFTDNMESGSAKWTPSAIGIPGWSLSNNGAGNDYWTGTVRRSSSPREISLATTNSISITSSSAILTFRHQMSIGGSEVANVEMSTNGGTSYPTVLASWDSGNDPTSWRTETINISSGLPSNTVKIRFRLVTTGTSGSTNRTWDVDDVNIQTPPQLVDWSTIAVRITEKTVTDSYFGSGTQRVNDIEIFYGTPTQNGTGGNTTPLDPNRDGNPQDTYNWPPNPIPASLAAGDDHFTLVPGTTLVSGGWTGWDADGSGNAVPTATFLTGFQTTIQGEVNSPCRFRLVSGPTANETNAVIRTNCYLTNGLTQSSFTNRYEVGLIAFGNHAANNIYFDNFGFKFAGSTSGGADGSGTIILSP